VAVAGFNNELAFNICLFLDLEQLTIDIPFDNESPFTNILLEMALFKVPLKKLKLCGPAFNVSLCSNFSVHKIMSIFL
jgi:hypothetical protein